jgi:hypothetical protein
VNHHTGAEDVTQRNSAEAHWARPSHGRFFWQGIVAAVAVTWAVGAAGLAPAADNNDAPWKTNRPIVKVTKHLYKETPTKGNGIWIQQYYVGPGLQRMEVQSLEVASDISEKVKYHFSDDNGRTWSPFSSMPNTVVRYGDISAMEGFSPSFYDPEAGVLFGHFLRQIIHRGTYACFTYYKLSFDYGRTWSEPRQFTYEPGELFDPAKPTKDSYVMNNRGAYSNMTIRHSNGTILYCLTAANIPKDAPDPDPQRNYGSWDIAAGERCIGSMLMIGKWDKARRDYDWTHSNCVWLPRQMSNRGLQEGEPIELADKRVLVVWRGSNTNKTPGRKWFAISTDGGRTLGEVRQWKYDDGSPFYSPASYHRFYRSSKTGKLYWIGNICPTPPNADDPRYPLVIAEVDQAAAALKKNTVTAIDDRKPGQPASIQFSNFSILENRETLEMEMYMSVYGAYPGQTGLTANADKYVIEFL